MHDDTDSDMCTHVTVTVTCDSCLHIWWHFSAERDERSSLVILTVRVTVTVTVTLTVNGTECFTNLLGLQTKVQKNQPKLSTQTLHARTSKPDHPRATVSLHSGKSVSFLWAPPSPPITHATCGSKAQQRI